MANPEIIAVRDVRALPWDQMPVCDWKWWFRPQLFTDVTQAAGISGNEGGAGGAAGGGAAFPDRSSEDAGEAKPVDQPTQVQNQPTLIPRSFSIPKTGATKVHRYTVKKDMNLGRTAQQRRLRAFHRDCGMTPDCTACPAPAGRPHSQVCKARQKQWEHQQLQSSGAVASVPDTDGEVQAPTLDIKMDTVEEQATSSTQAPRYRVIGKRSPEELKQSTNVFVIGDEGNQPQKLREIQIEEDKLQPEDRLVTTEDFVEQEVSQSQEEENFLQQMPSYGDRLGPVSTTAFQCDPDDFADESGDASASSHQPSEADMRMLLEDSENMELSYLHFVAGENFYDDLTGERFNPILVHAAKEKERNNMWRWPVFKKISKAEAIRHRPCGHLIIALY